MEEASGADEGTRRDEANNSSASVGKDEAGEEQGGNTEHDTGATVAVGKEKAEECLENGGNGSDAGAAGAAAEEQPLAASSGESEGRPSKRPPRVGSVRQGRKLKRKAAWEAKKAWVKENKRLAREKRCVVVSCEG